MICAATGTVAWWMMMRMPGKFWACCWKPPVTRCRLYPSGSSLPAEKDIDQIDCVIIDQNMPGLRGTDVPLQIDRRQLPLPSILITGAVDHEVTAAAQRLGAMTMMVEPLLSDELLRSVEAASG